MYQKITIIGNIGRDPIERFTKDGKNVTEFSLGVSEGSQDRRTTAWFRCSAWNQSGKYILNFAKKGAKVLVEGRLSYDSATGGPRLWTGNDGANRSAFEITVGRAVIITRPDGTEQAIAQAKQAGNALPIEDSEDIPF